MERETADILGLVLGLAGSAGLILSAFGDLEDRRGLDRDQRDLNDPRLKGMPKKARDGFEATDRAHHEAYRPIRRKFFIAGAFLILMSYLVPLVVRL
ncbi:MAG: hypothetical protein NXI16_06890 [Alphaproteobacteria bacterium]|nr:hypothetical protein [Alphaproteobacteria bacterium]